MEISAALENCFMLEFEFVSDFVYQYLKAEVTAENLTMKFLDAEHWKSKEKPVPVLFAELMKKFVAKYSNPTKTSLYVKKTLE